MKIFLVFIMTVHGLIHLLGFVKGFGLADVNQLTLRISRQAGVAWLLAALLFLLSGLLYGLGLDAWWMVGAPALLISQTLIFLTWHDAKFGTIATLIILFPLIISIANALPGSFRNIYTSEVEKGLARYSAMPLVTEADVKHLPVPVQRYLSYAGAIGKPKIQNFRAVFVGQIRRAPGSGWMDFTAQQYDFFDDPTRVFSIESSMFGIPFDGLHLYAGRQATMEIKVASLFQIVDAKGDTMTKGETVTLFNDMCVMAPATLIDSSIQWVSIDSLTAKGTYTNKGYTISAILYFNSDGALVDFSSDDRYMSADGITYTNYRWTTPLKNYEEFDGRKVPTNAELIWHTPEGKYVYGKFDLKQIEYNCRTFN
jgi:hypothetical protein